ncbi:nuclear transport factor 2 family protein [Comamonas sp. w2-DMI]|uniref:YybH family protein n=1 Tax=Comamonas sp. w2-DMI TaxID=3126391 RepID=UPI0032E384F1
MFKVLTPAAMNETFARAFNSRDLAHLLALYEPDAALRVDGSTDTWRGRTRIAEPLSRLLAVPGRMVSHNNFCIECAEIALLRADWTLYGDDGGLVANGSTAEVVRRQADGRWLYVIDHAAALSLPAGHP